MKRILVMNLGSTSFKLKLYEMGAQERLTATGGVENVGGAGAYSVRVGDRTESGACECKTHADAMEKCMAILGGMGVCADLRTLDAVGYKAVHGGRVSGAKESGNKISEFFLHKFSPPSS